ncbi:MAG: lipopolysaccharide biosynthesis protein [Bowdeniella nasicola]|nr:lipopolysaccharide biosynthesis protein [Bowdeniella nasicola]
MTARRRHAFHHLATRYPVIKNIGVLLSGTVIAQLIAVGTQPIITRLYSDQDLGLFSLWLVIPQTVVLVAAFRYDMAVVLPPCEADARRLLRISALFILLTATTTSVVCFLSAERLAALMGEPELAPWLGFTGVFVLGLGFVNLMTHWFTRVEAFRSIAANRIQMFSSISGVKILAAWTGRGGQLGLVGGQLIGQLLAAITMAIKAWRPLCQPSGSSTPVRVLLHRYRKMPLLNAPNAIIDGLRLNGIVLCLGLTYSTEAVGQFSQAWLLMQAPVTLIAGAISQVFYQKFAAARRGYLRQQVIASLKVSAAGGLGPFVVLGIVSPVLFPWFLGPGWELAGLLGQSLVLWLYLNVATAPISTIFVVTNRQELMLGFALLYMVTPLALILTLGKTMTINALMWVLSCCMALLLLGLVALTLRVAASYDRGATTMG